MSYQPLTPISPFPQPPSQPRSPSHAQNQNHKDQVALMEAQEELKYLQDRFKDVDSIPERIIQSHIDLLHKYNEIKDTTQSLIARYAQVKGLQLVAVHEQLGLPTRDE